jgi:hypothetical protein
MPNITTTLYLSDEDYNDKFMPRKKEILNRMREVVRKELGVTPKQTTEKKQ